MQSFAFDSDEQSREFPLLCSNEIAFGSKPACEMIRSSRRVRTGPVWRSGSTRGAIGFAVERIHEIFVGVCTCRVGSLELGERAAVIAVVAAVAVCGEVFAVLSWHKRAAPPACSERGGFDGGTKSSSLVRKHIASWMKTDRETAIQRSARSLDGSHSG